MLKPRMRRSYQVVFILFLIASITVLTTSVGAVNYSTVTVGTVNYSTVNG